MSMLISISDPAVDGLDLGVRSRCACAHGRRRPDQRLCERVRRRLTCIA